MTVLVKEAFDQTVISKLGEVLKADQISTSQAVRDQHGKDPTFHDGHAPDVVVFPETTQEVAAVVKICAETATPVVPYGRGTSLEGHIAALQGGVCIDLSHMNAILEVNNEDLDCRVQAGVTRMALNEYLRDTGLFFPIDPGADASLGGMTATRASGTNAVRYGTMRENVLGLTVVTADGRIVKTGGRARKSSAGYDLTRVFVGSEGTLGVVTEVQLRLYGIPEAISAAVCGFETLEGAVNTVISTIQCGVPVARIELLDEVQIHACNRHSKLDFAEKPTLFFEFHGSESGVAEQAETVQALAEEFGGQGFEWTSRAEDRTRLWTARHNAFWAAKELRPGAEAWSTDVCVPISKLAECILETRKELDAAGVIAPLVGHAGDGNFHLLFMVDPDDAEEIALARSLNDTLVMRAIAMGGTCTGEHGVGYGKIKFLQEEQGQAVALMRSLKQAFDPQGIMNPGKILPD